MASEGICRTHHCWRNLPNPGREACGADLMERVLPLLVMAASK